MLDRVYNVVWVTLNVWLTTSIIDFVHQIAPGRGWVVDAGNVIGCCVKCEGMISISTVASSVTNARVVPFPVQPSTLVCENSIRYESICCHNCLKSVCLLLQKIKLKLTCSYRYNVNENTCGVTLPERSHFFQKDKRSPNEQLESNLP